MGEVIRVEGLTASYDGRAVLRDLSFTLSDGQVLAVVGPNGSGKTTLLRALLGTLPGRAGRVELFGKRRLSSAEAESMVAYIPQRMEVDRTFPITLGEMLALSVARAPLARYMEMLELTGLMDERVGDLSGGQMQRALLAYAILKEPRLLVMDEPTSWVDVRGADCVLCIMEEFRKKGISMVIVSHDFSVIRSAATHVLGLGPEGHFSLPAGSPELEARLSSLFGTHHHEGVAACRPLLFQSEKGSERGHNGI